MRILSTITAYPPSVGGAQLHAHMLNQQLNKFHHVKVICHWNKNRTDWLLGTTLWAPGCHNSYLIDGIKVHQLGITPRQKLKLLPWVSIYYPFMKISLSHISDFYYELLEDHVDSVDLIHNVRIGREGLSLASLKLARKRDIPFVFSPLHHPRWEGWPYLEYLKIYRDADMVTTLTHTEKNTLIHLGVDENNITVIGHGPILSDNAFPEEFIGKHNIHGPVVLFLGQHYSYKGYQQLLEATKIVWKKKTDTIFMFIGPHSKDSDKYFKSFNDSRIQRLGIVDIQTKTNALASCDLLCVPSTQESFGGVYTEAWSFGKPVIGCNIPAVAEVISNEVDGFLVEQNAKQIANRIIYLLENSTEATKMGMAGRKKVESNYAWDKISKRVQQAYQKAAR